MPIPSSLVISLPFTAGLLCLYSCCCCCRSSLSCSSRSLPHHQSLACLLTAVTHLKKLSTFTFLDQVTRKKGKKDIKPAFLSPPKRFREACHFGSTRTNKLSKASSALRSQPSNKSRHRAGKSTSPSLRRSPSCPASVTQPSGSASPSPCTWTKKKVPNKT